MSVSAGDVLSFLGLALIALGVAARRRPWGRRCRKVGALLLVATAGPGIVAGVVRGFRDGWNSVECASC